MKIVQSIVSAAVVLIILALVYQTFQSGSIDSRLGTTERDVRDNRSQIEAVQKENRSQDAALQKQEKEIAGHTDALGLQGREIEALKVRVLAAEGKIADLSKAADADRAKADQDRSEIEKLRKEIAAISSQMADLDQKRKEFDELRRELKKSLDRNADMERNATELERRLSSIEKQLGVERPQS